jgi:hypothetical protein
MAKNPSGRLQNMQKDYNLHWHRNKGQQQFDGLLRRQLHLHPIPLCLEVKKTCLQKVKRWNMEEKSMKLQINKKGIYIEYAWEVIIIIIIIIIR